MSDTYQVTPEMVGLTWRRVLIHGLRVVGFPLVCWILLSELFYKRVISGSAVVGAALGVLICVLLLRPLSRSKLRISDVAIEELDGPVIHKNEITCVNEYSNNDTHGIEIFKKPRRFRKYSIFVPAALPQYEHIKRVVQEWTNPRDWHRLTRRS